MLYTLSLLRLELVAARMISVRLSITTCSGVLPRSTTPLLLVLLGIGMLLLLFEGVVVVVEVTDLVVAAGVVVLGVVDVVVWGVEEV